VVDFIMDKELIPFKQETVQFYDDEVPTVTIRDTVYVPLKPICEQLGLDWSSQVKRLKRDIILNEVSMSVVITTTDINMDSRRPHTSEMIAIPLDYLNGFLFGINAVRVKDEIRDKVLMYQRECYRVLSRHFLQQEPTSPTLLAVRNLGMAITQLAEEQIAFDRQLKQQGELVRETTIIVTAHDQRLEELEEAIASDAAVVTPDEAMQISQAVKTVAIAEGKRTGRNEFGATYGELYRKFGVTSYKQVPRSKFKHVMKWLNEWFISVSDDDWPF